MKHSRLCTTTLLFHGLLLLCLIAGEEYAGSVRVSSGISNVTDGYLRADGSRYRRLLLSSSCPVISGYVFFSNYDSNQNDLTSAGALSPATLASKCNSYSNCKGFNTNGFLKTKILQKSAWYTWGSPDPCKGLYVRTQKCLEITPTRQGLKDAAVAAVGKTIYYTQGGARWSGISSYVCPKKLPPSADCSSFVTWLYWAAFGFYDDDNTLNGLHGLNGESWGSGFTGTLAKHGVRLASIDAAQPGDLCFYGSGDFDHVTMYIGNKQVVSFGGPAAPLKEGNAPVKQAAYNYHPKGFSHCRSYATVFNF